MNFDNFVQQVQAAPSADLLELPPLSANEAHKAVRRYTAAIRSELDRNDMFGSFLSQYSYCPFPVNARGIFGLVRELSAAVTAAGGKLADARNWTAQAIRWWQEGKAVDREFARFEVDERAAKAMDSLIKLLQALPDDLLTLAPTAAQPATASGRSPFGAKPTSPFAPQPAALPGLVAACFVALSTCPKPDSPFAKSLLGALKSGAPEEDDLAGPLPDDLGALVDRWRRIVTSSNFLTDEEDGAADLILHKLGQMNNPRTVDYLYAVYHQAEDNSDEINLLATFARIGGDVGVAGLMSLLPLNKDTREEWLTAMVTIAQRSRSGIQPLSETSLNAIWKIAIAESAEKVAFCAPALNLLAAIGRPEALPILWTYAHSDNADRRRIALLALLQFDPGDKLMELLTLLGDLPPVQPRPASPFGQAKPQEPLAELTIRIPFEQLEPVVTHPNAKLAAMALKLISFLKDERVAPLLTSQLSATRAALREVALIHLRRLKASGAAAAVAELAARDADLRERAAEVLCEWRDLRCVPFLLKQMTAGSEPSAPKAIVAKLDAFDHPVYRLWLTDTVDALRERDDDGSDSALSDIVDCLAERKSANLDMILCRLVDSPSSKVRYAVVGALSSLEADWAFRALRQRLMDSEPQVSYRALTLCKQQDETQGETILTLNQSSHELMRMLAVRLLWQAKDTPALVRCLSDRSAAVRDAAAWALVDLQDAPEELARLVQEADCVSLWGHNLAVMAWEALAKLGQCPL